MTPQYVRFIIEEVLEGKIGFYPTYGNTLMGLAASVPLRPEDNFSVTYYAPQPRAVLRVVKPNETSALVEYGAWGRVELTTLTRELFLPRFLERDEAVRRQPRAPYALGWSGRCQTIRSDGKEHRRRSVLNDASPYPSITARQTLRQPG